MTDPAGGTGGYDVVMCTFRGIGTASQVLERLRHEGSLEGCEIEGEALVSRDREGHVHFHEKGSAGIGAAFGAATAGVLGLVGGPAILAVMLVAGGVMGGVAGHFAGQAFPHEDLRRVAHTLHTDSSAYLAVVDAAHADRLAAAFRAEGAEVLEVPVETEVASVIREAITHQVRRV